MSAPKFTPGPWEIREHGKGFSIRGDRNSIPVAEIGGLNYPPDVDPEAWESARADARLIAVAPDLLDALCLYLGHVTCPPTRKL